MLNSNEVVQNTVQWFDFVNIIITSRSVKREHVFMCFSLCMLSLSAYIST